MMMMSGRLLWSRIPEPSVTESVVLPPDQSEHHALVQRREVQSINFCRFAMTAADSLPSHEFCAFDFPGCKACPKALRVIRTVRSLEDPMNSEVCHAWISRLPQPKRLAPVGEHD